MNRALFLDRDGVINVEKNYVYRIEDFEFVDGVFDLCAVAQKAGFRLVVVTNQAGIGRGFYSEDDFHKLNDWMIEQFHTRSIAIDRVYFCPFHPVHGIGKYKRDSSDRKPGPGMILRASTDLDLDLDQSILVGDKQTDIEAGIAAGVRHNVLVGSESAHNDVPLPDLRVVAARLLAGEFE